MKNLDYASKFHGHLGPWLVIGLIIGGYGLRKIKARKYFGLKINASVPYRKPFSCLIDGLQISSGCTLGKGNIRLANSGSIKVTFTNLKNKMTISLGIKEDLLKVLYGLKTHEENIKFAKILYRMKADKIVRIIKGAV